MPELKDNLFEFAYLGDYASKFKYLSDLAIDEDWSYEEKENSHEHEVPILHHYLEHTFKRLVFEEKQQENGDKIYTNFNKMIACFNTGLFTEFYNPIFAFFKEHTNPEYDHEFYLEGFYTASHKKLDDISLLPRRAEYFEDLDDLIFNTEKEIRINGQHILKENKDRVPKEIKEQNNLYQSFHGAVDMARKRIKSNYREAIPQYYNNKIQFLVPIYLIGENPDLALVIEDQGDHYAGRTCLTLDMAYENARLISKPTENWLKR